MFRNLLSQVGEIALNASLLGNRHQRLVNHLVAFGPAGDETAD